MVNARSLTREYKLRNQSGMIVSSSAEYASSPSSSSQLLGSVSITRSLRTRSETVMVSGRQRREVGSSRCWVVVKEGALFFPLSSLIRMECSATERLPLSRRVVLMMGSHGSIVFVLVVGRWSFVFVGRCVSSGCVVSLVSFG